MKLRDIMTEDVFTLEPSASLSDAAREMKRLNIGAIPICDGDIVQGLLTDRDIVVRAIAEGQDPDNATAADVMSTGVEWCFADDDVAEAAAKMRDLQIRRLLVLDDDRKLVGMVALGDLATEEDNPDITARTLKDISEPSQPGA